MKTPLVILSNTIVSFTQCNLRVKKEKQTVTDDILAGFQTVVSCRR